MNAPEINIFADINTLEPEALQDFYKAMALPEAVQGALMPDCHKGYTLPIGSVVMMHKKVFPSYVGFDIGCTDKDTEYLTPTGWKKISDYAGEEILLYNKDTTECSFGKPNAYIKKDCEKFYHLDNGVVDQMLTDEHNVPMFSTRNHAKQIDKKLTDWISDNKRLTKGVNQHFKCFINLNKTSYVNFSDNEIRLLIAISADGCIRRSGKIEFHLKKERKISRLTTILRKLGIDYTEYNIKDDTWGCSFYWDKATKDLSWVWMASSTQLVVISQELPLWDGHTRKGGTLTYATKIKEHADIAQYVFTCCGYRTNIHCVEYKDKENWNESYTVYTTKNKYVQFPKEQDIHLVDSVDGKCYCFNTPTGYWVMRKNGKIVITGNCGMCALRTDVRLEELPKPVLINLRDLILTKIPLGRDTHSKPQKLPHNYDLWAPEAKKIFDDLAAIQCGSLGSGNHFAELGIDNSGFVNIIIHSGSRGVGKKVAEYYMKMAAIEDIDKARYESEFDTTHAKMKQAVDDGKCSIEKYNADKEKFVLNRSKARAKGSFEGHYGFQIDSEMGKMYLHDLDQTLLFALDNREMMINAILGCMETCVGRKINTSRFINRNHNHAEVKGDNVIHRKGCTHADFGMLGVIPGNMYDGSFIVRGRGNPKALCSSSHGAGRVMSRRKAKDSIDFESFKDEMKGVVNNITESTIDEAPEAYKDIFDVMEQQSDLVETIDYVKPILNIKG